MNKIDKYINKLSKIKYNISNPKYDIYSKKIGYYMTGGAITNSQLMSLIVMYLLIENSPETTTSAPQINDKAEILKAKLRAKQEAKEAKEKKEKSSRTKSDSDAPASAPTATAPTTYVSPSKPRNTPQQDSIDEKINELFKEFDSKIKEGKIEVDNQEKNKINSKKNSIKRLIKNDENIRQKLDFDKINMANIPISKLLILKALLLSETIDIKDIHEADKETLKKQDASINKQEAKEYVQEKQRKIREEEERQEQIRKRLKQIAEERERAEYYDRMSYMNRYGRYSSGYPYYYN